MTAPQIRRRSLPDSLRWLADQLDSGALSEAEQAGVALTLRMLADDISPPAARTADGDPDTRCGASHRTEYHGVARCSRGQGHTGTHAGYADDSTHCQWAAACGSWTTVPDHTPAAEEG